MNNSELAEQVRQACLHAALTAYEEGGLLGLCQQGRFELAMDAVRTLDLNRLPNQAGEQE
ncbi:acetyltransferase [Zobellella maritima]|uniref:acetyltransferase n=1 Tax=Zobellella maritima TaxID=2059725 RepID=UPI000E306422|nr:acetyltransferase [Zobellella maritima]